MSCCRTCSTSVSGRSPAVLEAWFLRELNGDVSPGLDRFSVPPGGSEPEGPDPANGSGVERRVPARFQDYDAVDTTQIRDTHLEDGAPLDALIPKLQGVLDRNRRRKGGGALDLRLAPATHDPGGQKGGRPSGPGNGGGPPAQSVQGGAAHPTSRVLDSALSSNSSSKACLGVMSSGSIPRSRVTIDGSAGAKSDS